MKYQWILFDADDTIFDFTKSAKVSLVRTLNFFKIPAEQAYIELYKKLNHETWLAFERKEITAVELRRIRFQRFLDAIGEFRDPMEMNGHYLNELSQTDILIEGARKLVEELREKGLQLALITNGLKEVQRPRIAKAGMGHHFDVIVVSDEIGVAKPHPGFFEHAFGKMGQPQKEKVLVVGDSLSSDIQGGNKFGLDTCWFNPVGASNISGHTPKFEITKLESLWDII